MCTNVRREKTIRTGSTCRKVLNTIAPTIRKIFSSYMPAENLAPGRHRHSQTAAVSSRRGDQRRGAQPPQLTGASHWCSCAVPTRPAAGRGQGDGRRARAYLRRNPTFPLDVEPWGGRRCAALPRYVECPATTVAYAKSTLGPRAAVRPKSPCASCAPLPWQTAPRRAICGSDRPFSALRDHFLRHFQQPASECKNDAQSHSLSHSPCSAAGRTRVGRGRRTGAGSAQCKTTRPSGRA